MVRPVNANLTSLEEKALGLFKERVNQTLGARVLEYRLFGSRARGVGDENSDLDVLVITTETGVSIKNTIWDIANDLLLELEVDISPLVMSREEFRNLLARERRLVQEIEKEGIPL